MFHSVVIWIILHIYIQMLTINICVSDLLMQTCSFVWSFVSVSYLGSLQNVGKGASLTLWLTCVIVLSSWIAIYIYIVVSIFMIACTYLFLERKKRWHLTVNEVSLGCTYCMTRLVVVLNEHMPIDTITCI